MFVISFFKFIEDGPQGTIKVALKYDPATKANAIKCLKRVSTPGLRKYTGYKVYRYGPNVWSWRNSICF
ncbi:MAG: 30S ribosomal protein S8 [Prevotella sp.]|nr:30S ribosomal protein S8 [Prevotella sp.]